MSDHTLKAPISPYWVLLIAIVLPGVGQVMNHAPLRGFTMVMFMLILAMITFHLAGAGVSIIGKYAGGLFVYLISILDAYYWAKYRSVVFFRAT